jgi:hypothetical protein
MGEIGVSDDRFGESKSRKNSQVDLPLTISAQYALVDYSATLVPRKPGR